MKENYTLLIRCDWCGEFKGTKPSYRPVPVGTITGTICQPCRVKMTEELKRRRERMEAEND